MSRMAEIHDMLVRYDNSGEVSKRMELLKKLYNYRSESKKYKLYVPKKK